MVDAVIDVTAPVDIRTKRVMQRNGLGYDEVMRRINSQNYIVDRPHPKVYTIKMTVLKQSHRNCFLSFTN